jgi:hypothetical protein
MKALLSHCQIWDSFMKATAIKMTSRIVSLSPDDSKIDMDAESQTQPQKPEDMDQKKEEPMPPVRQDAFGDEEFAEVKYKVLKWWCVFRSFAHMPRSRWLLTSSTGKEDCSWLPRLSLWASSHFLRLSEPSD